MRKIILLILCLVSVFSITLNLTGCGECKHAYNDGEITTEATCQNIGEKTYTCTKCGETKTEVIEKLNHLYDNSGDATCNNCSFVRELSVTGEGTQTNPYVLYSAEHFSFIGENEDNYYYYKVAEDIEVIDATNLPQVNLNGSFDGSGVKFTNVNKYMFRNVGLGISSDTTPVKISNFTVDFVGGMGVVRCCGVTSLKFENINVVGYMLCDWNAGAFLRYGTENVVDGGFSYTVDFVNCSTEVEIYSSSNSYSAILIGHPYQGNGNIVTINVDAITEENLSKATLYYTGNGTPFGNKYHCMSIAGVTVNVEGVETPINKVTEGVIKVDSTKKAEKNTQTGKYQITTEEDTKKVVVSLLMQYTVYSDETYTQKILEESGVGGRFSTIIEFEVANSQTVDVLETISSVSVVNNSEKFDYEIRSGELIIYLTNDSSYIDGRIELTVEQFTEGCSIAKYIGSVNVAVKSGNENWVIA